MKLVKAIEILNQCIKTWEPNSQSEVRAAFKLGIEALKRVKWHQDQHQPRYYELLPGEDQED